MSDRTAANLNELEVKLCMLDLGGSNLGEEDAMRADGSPDDDHGQLYKAKNTSIAKH